LENVDTCYYWIKKITLTQYSPSRFKSYFFNYLECKCFFKQKWSIKIRRYERIKNSKI